jgi:uncharacterized protein YecE (DUF72 family)
MIPKNERYIGHKAGKVRVKVGGAKNGANRMLRAVLVQFPVRCSVQSSVLTPRDIRCDLLLWDLALKFRHLDLFELELERIHTQMAQKAVQQAEVYARASRAS